MDQGEYFLLPDEPGYVLVMDGVAHSWLDPDDPTRLEFGYMQRMADFLESIEPVGGRIRVIHVGGAAMTMARYIAARRPTSAQIVLEPNEGVTDMVRREIPLPANSGVKVRPVDGRYGIAQMRDDYARVVIVDAFSDARVPEDLATTEFFADVRRVLTADGMLLMNLIDNSPLAWTRRVLAGVGEHFPDLALCAETAVFKGRRHGNLVVAAARTPLPVEAVTRRAAGSAFPFRVIWGADVTRFTGAAESFRDGASEPSPIVERGLLTFE